MSKSALIKFRCDQGVSDAVDRIAAKQRRQRADLLRLWLDDFVKAEDRPAARKKKSEIRLGGGRRTWYSPSMKASSLLACLAMLAGCATSDREVPGYARPGWQPDGRLRIATVDSLPRAPRAHVELYQAGDSLPPHAVVAFISADGDAGDEARVVDMMLEYGRHVGADGVALLAAERPNERLLLAHPLWQPAGRRVFRANIIVKSAEGPK